MVKFVRNLIVGFAVLLISSGSALAQKGEFVAPDGAEMEKFPIFSENKPLSTIQMAEMKLSPRKLEAPVVVQNHFRGLSNKEGRFVVEKLPVGTVVLVDTDGNIRYKADCGNRLVEFANTAINHKTATTPKVIEKPKEVAQKPVASQEKKNPSLLFTLWERVKDLLDPIARILGWIVLAILLAGLLYAIYEAGRGGPGGPRPTYGPLPGTPTASSAFNQNAGTPPNGGMPHGRRGTFRHTPEFQGRPHLFEATGNLNLYEFEVMNDGRRVIRVMETR